MPHFTTAIKPRIGNAVARLELPDARITSDRYTSEAFMRAEMEYIWPRIWNIGARLTDIPEAGDFIIHKLAKDSILMVRQGDGSVKAFHNVCPHRGNRLVAAETGAVDVFTCSYHGWQFGHDGTLVTVQDAEDFPQGNPCGKLGLSEILCEVWAGFVWYNMDLYAPSLSAFLGEVKDILDGYRIDKMTRFVYNVAEVPCNWKCIHDNFCESYHLPQTHPQLSEFFDDDYRNTDFFEFRTGHNLMKMKGGLPSARDQNPYGINPVLAEEMRVWGLEPADFAGRAHEVRTALQQAKRKLGPSKGFDHFDGLTDDQLTDPYHFNLFAGTTITMSPTSLGLQRAEPHPTDPNKCIYEQWNLAHGADADGMVASPTYRVPFREAEKEVVVFGQGSLGFVPDQDLRVAQGQQLGFQSRGFKGAYLSGQEHRIQQFHNCIDLFIAEGRED